MMLWTLRRPRFELEAGEFLCHLDEEGFEVASTVFRHAQRWIVYQGAFLDNANLYLMLGRNFAQAFPLAAIPDRDRVLDLLRRHGLLRAGDEKIRIRISMNYRRGSA